MSDDLPTLPSLERLGASFSDAAAAEIGRARRRRRRRLQFGSVLAGGLVLAGGAAGAAQLIGIGTPLSDNRNLSPKQRPTVGGAQRVAAVVREPASDVEWGARIYTSASGLSCATAGRLRAGRIGVQEGTSFRPLDANAFGACGRPVSGRLFFTVLQPKDPLPRTLVFGRTGGGIRSVRLRTPNVDRVIRTGAGGVFLAVFSGRDLTERDVSVTPVS